MPVEGHAERLVTPLRRRDRIVLAAVAAAAAVAAVVLVVAWATRPAPPSNAGCVVVAVPSTMGGTTLRGCGAAAHALCRTRGRVDRTIAEACAAQGFAADVQRFPAP
jgi:peptidoglycan/LPS O-acetylase OafA/YrhL